MSQSELCKHLQSLEEIKTAEKYECAECVKHGGRWVHLRTCQTCGITLCCDDSPSQHMSHHQHETSHPVISSAEPGERWLWCIKDDAFAEY